MDDCDKNSTICSNTEGSFNCECRQGFSKLDRKTCKTQKNLADSQTTNFQQTTNDLETTNVQKMTSFQQTTNVQKTTNVQETTTDFVTTKDSQTTNVQKTTKDLETTSFQQTTTDFETCKLPDDPKEKNENEPRTGCHPLADCVAIKKQKNQCLCQPGFTGDGINDCRDIDECKNKSTDPCQNGIAKCQNSLGSFQCVCKTGFRTIDEIFCEGHLRSFRVT